MEYDVIVVHDRLGGSGTWNASKLNEILNARAREGWRLAELVREKTRLLLILERPA
jgi:hypothetical protein